MNNIDAFVQDLLHIDEVAKNKLLDLEAGKENTYYLTYGDPDDPREDLSRNGEMILNIIKEHIGKVGNTVLRGSAADGEEQLIGAHRNVLNWCSKDGKRDPKALDKYIRAVYKEVDLTGNNPLFLSVGTVSWKLVVSKDETKVVQTPFLIFPIRLIRSVATSPIAIEFLDEDIYLNPCFIAKMRQVYGEEILRHFPMPSGTALDFDSPVDLELIGNGKEYFNSVERYIDSCRGEGEENVFAFDRNAVAISQYDHDEICMYYDIRRNKEKVYDHPLVNRLFTESLGGNIPAAEQYDGQPSFILPTDRVQEDMIRRVLAGESLIIKGPPGTGKTLTIVNMIATLLEEGKRVMLASEKLAALSEVYNKLPDELRDFVMLLACETESQAAKLNPSVVKKDLSALVRAAETSVPLASSVYSDKSSALGRMSLARRTMNKYYTETFKETDVVGFSYYDALDISERNPDIAIPLVVNGKDIVPFVPDPRIFLGMSRETYNELYSTVVEATRHYSSLTADESHPMLFCPWYPVDGSSSLTAVDDVLEAYRALADRVSGILERIEALFAEEGLVNVTSLGITAVRDLLESPVTADDVLRIFERGSEGLTVLREAFLALSAAPAEALDYVSVKAGVDFVAAKTSLSAEGVDGSLTKEELDLFYKHRELLSGIRLIELIKLTAITDKIKAQRASILEHRENMYSVFPTNLTPEGVSKIEAAVPVLAKYRGKGKPALFFGAPKAAYAELCAISYIKNPTFEQIVGAVCEVEDMMRADAKILELDGELSMLFRRTVSPEEREAIMLLADKALDATMPVASYTEAINNLYNSLSLAFSAVEQKTDEVLNVSMLRDIYAAADAVRVTERALASWSGEEREAAEAYTGELLRAVYKETKAILAVSGVIYTDAFSGVAKEQLAEAIAAITAKGKALSSDVAAWLCDVKKLSAKSFETIYSLYQDSVTLDNLAIFVKEAPDKNVLNAAERYLSTRDVKIGGVSVAAFFYPYERGYMKREGYAFPDILEHSVFALACIAKKSGFELRNGRGSEIARQMEIYAECDNQYREYNTRTIRESCLERVRTTDKNAFAFLNSSRDNINNLRRIFKLHGESILKLKKCMLVSPATVSVLFGSPAFESFDVLIVDEASQLEPTKILPVLFRSKQLVLVGDEWQMPPIKHFTKAAEHTVVSDQGTLTNLSPETSVLSLALHSKQFDTCELVCHYRSKTEALIAFSQENYYPFMRTFPACIPRANGLGFKDVYIPEGRSEGGVNEAEAAAAVRELRLHFDTYYDEASGTLSESVGVVAFGEAQLSKIEQLVKSDLQLKAMIGRALDNFDDLPEKLIFFKTIETVQGQETDHMILSLAYGKDKNGKVREAYGDLGRGSFGECIFNVAVTRARSSITVIHSILHGEISNRFIKSYLEITEKFDKDGRMQFISDGDTNRPGFIRSVADYIINELGIPEERVVINCGATGGSVRVPIAILSPDMSEAQLAIFCEKPAQGRNYIDSNIRYYNILAARGWKLHRVFIHDWVDNRDNEKQNIRAAIMANVTL